MLTTILFWTVCTVFYLATGFMIAVLSIVAWNRQTKEPKEIQKDPYSLVHRIYEIKSPTLLFFLMFPNTAVDKEIHLCNSSIPLLLPNYNDRHWKDGVARTDGMYMYIIMLLWPLKMITNSITISFFLIHFLFVRIEKKALKTINSIGELPASPPKPSVMIRVIEQRPADKLDSLKRELGDTEVQTKKLQEKSKELLAEIQKLESQQTAEEGLTVFRADRSSESKWRSSSN